ncbi:MAG TPA: OmcA/MtrC family decaheme c-type cytochrome [Thermoanaerobaculia bacterium]|nr:OmcA/MtrC family decaheme c-type cytochrome [Thermoanaerobaculia bacterium]
MRILRPAAALALVASGFIAPSSRSATRVIAPRGDAAENRYGRTAAEYYLTAEQTDYVRPGFKIKINSVTIGGNRKPVVDVTITDDLGQPIDRKGILTPGPVTLSFVLAWYEPSTRNYTTYATRKQTSPITGASADQPTSDSGGVYTDVDLGHFTYTFGTVLPSGFDMTKTHTLAAYGRRSMPAEVLNGKVYIDNDELDFRPDSQPVTAKWDEIQERNACNQCHNPLQAHGDVRQDAKLCVLCHSPQNTDPDTGNLLDMRVFIHKIHRGKNLPSVQAGTPYHIVGNAQTDHDFSTVVFPQDIRNCQNCHEGRNPAQKPSQSDVWYTKPARAPCGACHDNIDWVTGANHPGGPQPNDLACASCHVPQGDSEYDASIKGAHTVPYRSKQLKGLNATILSVDNVGAGKKPVVTFKLTENDGTVLDPKPFGSSLNVLLGGPTTDYAIDPFRENASGATFSNGQAVYTFQNAIPASAKGSWAVAIEARRTINLKKADGSIVETYTEGAVNPVKYIAVTDPRPVPRRNVVVLENCNKCHDRLATTFSHGGQRIAIEECDMCHNPNASDKARRPADQNPPESIAFKRMIHRIHTGENLTQDFSVFGFGGVKNTFNEVRYPGDRRDCLQCHTSASTFDLPLPLGAIPVVTLRDYFSPQGPGTAACLGCHDNGDAAAHAFLNTVTFPGASSPNEACATCHGAGKDWDVAKVHAR